MGLDKEERFGGRQSLMGIGFRKRKRNVPQGGRLVEKRVALEGQAQVERVHPERANRDEGYVRVTAEHNLVLTHSERRSPVAALCKSNVVPLSERLALTKQENFLHSRQRDLQETVKEYEKRQGVASRWKPKEFTVLRSSRFSEDSELTDVEENLERDIRPDMIVEVDKDPFLDDIFELYG